MKQRGLLDDEIEACRYDPVFQTEGLSLDVCITLRRAMREQGVTQEELARRLGISQPAVAKYLNHNHNLTLATLARISSALGMEWTLSLATRRNEKAADNSSIAAEDAAEYHTNTSRRRGPLRGR